jgi:hypothetical protein
MTLSRYQLSVFMECPRCFWLQQRHGVKPPKSLPFALNNAIDHLLKAEFDGYRAQGILPPLLAAQGVAGKLFGDVSKLDAWRNNFQGVRWTNPDTGHTIFGAVDDILECPDGSLAVIDYKATGSVKATIYPSYQLQMDVYTYVLQQLGYRTAPHSYFVFYVVVKDDGFNGRLPFRGELLTVAPNPGRVPELFTAAVALAQSDDMPDAGAECDVCRCGRETAQVIGPG